MVLLVLFGLFLLGAIYPLTVYPLLVLAVARLRGRPWLEADSHEGVAHVITVHNEQDRIAAKLDNTLSLRAPAGGLRTIVVDDGSTDGTREVVERYRDRGVVWLGCARRGKESAQIEATRSTTEPILVFSDASTTVGADALLHLLRPFADPTVAAVSGTDRLEAAERGTGEDLYVRFEMAVRRAESLAGSLVGLSGCFFAVRRAIAEQWLPDAPSDMAAALLAIRDGKRAVAQDDAVCRYAATPEVGREFARKRRTALRGLRCLAAYAGVLRPDRPVVSWQVLSHKWLRFAVPWFLAGALLTAAAAAVTGRTWGTVVVGLALLAAAASAIAWRVAPLRRSRALRALGFLGVATSAVLVAWTDLLRGGRQVMWTPTRRPGGR